MIEHCDVAAASGSSLGIQPLYPASIAFLMEERPLLWCEDPVEYDQQLRNLLVELIPRGVIACIFVKNLADHFWELRRMMKLKHTAINCAMPRAAAKLLAPGYGDTITYVTRPRVEDQAKAVLYGDAAVELKAGEPTFEERMRAERVTSEMMVYRAHQEAAEWLEHISGECARIENRIHRLLRDFEARNATLASSARTLVEREAAQILGAERVN